MSEGQLSEISSISFLDERINACSKCILHTERTLAVPGVGNENADIMFIGEAPGKKEDLAGLPFIGASGRILSEMMESIGLTRDDAYIANVVKCRPPNNRDPKADEVDACFGYLIRQVQLIDPVLIVTLGRHSMNRFIEGEKIGEAHGNVFMRDVLGLGLRAFFPIYHPAASLYRPSLRQDMFLDFTKVPSLLKELQGDAK